MTTTEQEKMKVSVSQLQREFVTLAGTATTALIPVSIYAIVQLIRVGNEADYLFLLAGSILSVVAILGFIGNELTNGVRNNKSFLAMILALGGFIPWAFGTYLVLISGFWSLSELLEGFSSFVILKAIVFVSLGYILVSNFYKITEIGKVIHRGIFNITD
jgi:hypothetical protein